MHLIERYATDTGLQIDKPYIYEKYIPLPNNKFIVFHPHSKPAKTPDFWQDVLDLLLPILLKENIAIVQIGGKGEKIYGGVTNFVGNTDFGQVAFLIRNSLLFFGVDTFSCHFAGYYNKPIVCLYSNNNINNVKPYWGDKNKQTLIEPEREPNEKPNYVLDENPKSINKIRPEQVAEAILSQLNIKLTYPYKTIHTGARYFNRLIEMVPNNVIKQSDFNIPAIIVRMDYFHNEQVLYNQISQTNVNIITKNPINPKFLIDAKSRIQQIIYILDDKNNYDFVKFLHENAFNYALVCKTNESDLERYKARYMDFSLVIKDFHNKPNLNNTNKKLFYKSGKFTLSDGNIFHSKIDWLSNNYCNNLIPVVRPIINCNEFWSECEHFAILEEKD